jgi:pre-mRNA-processing factor 19
MSITTCKLTGVNLTKPVIDCVKGYVYQKEEIEKHIIKTGQCPVTGREMQLEDLVEIKPNKDLSLKTSLHTSENVPVILQKINNEWENMMIYNFQLKKELEDLNKESSNMLYQHEASNLVICRLLKEKEEYLSKLNYIKSQVKELNYSTKKEYEEESEFNYMGLTEDLTAKIMETGMALAKARKNRKLPANFCEKEKITKFKATANYLKEAQKSFAKAAYTCFDVHTVNSGLFISANLNAEISLNYFNKEEEKISDSLVIEKVNSKKINLVKFKKDESLISFISASADNTASVFAQTAANFNTLNIENLNSRNLKGLKIEEVYRITNHTNSVIGAEFHTLKDYCLVGSKDGFWSFHNYRKGICLTKQSGESKKEVNSLEMHPDGNIFKFI